MTQLKSEQFEELFAVRTKLVMPFVLLIHSMAALCGVCFIEVLIVVRWIEDNNPGFVLLFCTLLPVIAVLVIYFRFGLKTTIFRNRLIFVHQLYLVDYSSLWRWRRVIDLRKIVDYEFIDMQPSFSIGGGFYQTIRISISDKGTNRFFRHLTGEDEYYSDFIASTNDLKVFFERLDLDAIVRSNKHSQSQ